jgi:cytochrome b
VNPTTPGAPGDIRVWDPLVRLFHWSLVAGFATAWLSGEAEAPDLHVIAGYVVGGLILFRLVWGFTGPQHARFRDFVFPPATLLDYARELLRGQARRYLGHNPLGGAMVVVLLVALGVTTLSGLWFYAVHRQQGPFAGLVAGTATLAPIAAAHAHDREKHREHHAKDDGHGKDAREEFREEAHETSANLTLLLVVLHIGGVVLSSWLHRENLVRAMITGRKRA